MEQLSKLKSGTLVSYINHLLFNEILTNIFSSRIGKIQSNMQRVILILCHTFSHYRRALGALLVYDITKEQTFQSLKGWLENLKTHAEQDICIMLVGNKLDEVEKNPQAREVPVEAAREFAQMENLKFIETSAFTNSNVKEAFENLIQEIFVQRQKMPKSTPKNPLILENDTPGNTANKGCC